MAGRPTRGRILAGPFSCPCALGRSGLVGEKREGDGGTPVGRFRVLSGWFRADRVRRPRAAVALSPTRRTDGWCDDVTDRRYNRPVRLPYAGGHERMWREDGLYDVVLDLAYNRGPIRRGRGSAIFLHCARADLAPTEGCVALPAAALRRLLPLLSRRATVEVSR